MVTLRESVKALLETDILLSAILTGGIFDAETIDQQDGGGYDWAPKMPDGVRIAPHAVIRWRATNAYQASHVHLSAESEVMEIYLYSDLGYANLENAFTRIKLLLHNTYHATTDKALAHSTFTFGSPELSEPSLGNALMRFIRFQFIQIRQ